MSVPAPSKVFRVLAIIIGLGAGAFFGSMAAAEYVFLGDLPFWLDTHLPSHLYPTILPIPVVPRSPVSFLVVVQQSGRKIGQKDM